MTKEAVGERITFDPHILGGKPTLRGLRISVEQILRALSNHIPEEELLRDYPELEPEDLQAALSYAADRVADEKVYLLPTVR